MKHANRRFNKNATPISGIVQTALTRHGISTQITSAMAVKYANQVLDTIVDQKLRSDLRALSFIHDELTIVCRHSAASYLADTIRDQIKEILETQLPSVTVKNIICKIHPHLLDSTSEIH